MAEATVTLKRSKTPAVKERPSERFDFTGGGKGVTVRATKNIPLSLLSRHGADVPKKMLARPGGARIERDTKIHLGKEAAQFLKGLGLVE